MIRIIRYFRGSLETPSQEKDSSDDLANKRLYAPHIRTIFQESQDISAISGGLCFRERRKVSVKIGVAREFSKVNETIAGDEGLNVRCAKVDGNGSDGERIVDLFARIAWVARVLVANSESVPAHRREFIVNPPPPYAPRILSIVKISW